MKLLKTFLVILSVVTLALFSTFLNAQMLAGVSATHDLEKVARTFVNLIQEGKFEDAVELFNEKMAEVLPPQKLEKTWNKVISNVGEFKEIIETRITEERV